MPVKRNNEPTRKEFLKMPYREYKDSKRQYKYLYVIPDGTKHESGWMNIAIVGYWEQDGVGKHEICTHADNINWMLPDSKRESSVRPGEHYELAHLRTDCLYPQGVMRFWGSGKFTVDWGSSSEVRFIPDKKD